MNRFDIINRIGDKYRVGNTETGEFSYAQALKTVGKDIKDYQKATTGTQHKFLDIRFENERLVVLVECKNKFSRWDKAKIQGQLQDYVRFEKAYSDKKIVAILAETDGDEVWVWFGQSVIIDDEHRMEEETVLRTFEEYENLCFGRVNDKIKVVDSINITYTNAAVDVIAERLSQDSFILPSTIHSFAWSAIKQYQSTLMSIIDNDESLTTTETDFSKVLEIRYTLGHRYVSQGVHYLHHNDVLKLFCTLLDNAKFRRVFSDNYPLILIDEYQDSYKPIITRFVNFFIAEGIGPQFGFFGDAWQTIYQSNNACGAIEHSNLVEIKKGSNFRSAPRIVNLLNEIRPDLPQQSAIDNFEGEVVVVTCDDFSGARRSDRTFKDDLPAEELKSRLYQLSECIKKNVPKDENIKILMITHKVLATQQGYEQLLAIIDDGLRDKQDPFLLFFMNTVEPIYEALSTSNMQLLFDTLGIRRYPITKKSEKMKWKEFEARLKKARDGKAIDVINTIVETKLVPVPSLVDGYYHLYFDAPDTIYGLDATIRDVLDLDYSQFRAAIEFLYPEAEFSTEHGVKGEEYDNVVFVISKGWNQYQFETYAPMITGRTPIPNGKQTSYERNRNLFYVCCSRPRKRLFFFVSVPIDASFRVFLDDLVGAENIYTYGQYLEAKQ